MKLSDEAIELLKECYQRELNGSEPCNPLTHGFVGELLVKGLLTLEAYTYSDWQRKAAYFLTEHGREFIKYKIKEKGIS